MLAHAYVCVHTPPRGACLCGSEDSVQELVLSFHRVSSVGWSQVVRFGGQGSSLQLSRLISPGSLSLILGFCRLYDSWTFCPLRNWSLYFLDHTLWDIKLSILNDVQEGLFCCLWSQQDSIANPNHAVVFFKNVLVLILIVRSLIHLSFTFAYVVKYTACEYILWPSTCWIDMWHCW